MTYFDHNATHPLSSAARGAWIDAATRLAANPSAPHRAGARAAAAIDDARDRLAASLGCPARSLVWTSGATESANAVLQHLAGASTAELWLSAVEHPCFLAAAERWFPGRHRSFPVLPGLGTADLGWLADALRRESPAAVVLMAANNETGVLQPWREARDLCRAHGVPFVCDAAQWTGKLASHGLGECDYVVGCAHKFGGPAGVGWIRCPDGFSPSIVGGPQEEGRRAGTENVAGIVASAAALSERDAAIAANGTAERLAWRDRFAARLLAALPDAVVIGADAPRLWNTVAVLMPATADCRRRWVVKLDRLGIAASTGSACSSGREKPSHVLDAMRVGTGASDRMLRFSAGWETTATDWDMLLAAVNTAAAELGAARPNP